jgi:hypothetical protein
MTKAAIAGSFADFRIIKSRGVAQLVIEIDLANADAALAALGGVPQPASEKPVAVARLTDEATRKPSTSARERYEASDEAAQAVARAGILAADDAFHRWCGADGKAAAVHYIRSACRVRSRADIAADPEALARFLAMESRYRDESRFGPHATRHT